MCVCVCLCIFSCNQSLGVFVLWPDIEWNKKKKESKYLEVKKKEKSINQNQWFCQRIKHAITCSFNTRQWVYVKQAPASIHLTTNLPKNYLKIIHNQMVWSSTAVCINTRTHTINYQQFDDDILLISKLM